MKTKHLVMSIDGLRNKLNSLDSYFKKNKHCKDSFNVTYNKTLKLLDEMNSKGMLFIPSSDCKNQKPDGSCGC